VSENTTNFGMLQKPSYHQDKACKRNLQWILINTTHPKNTFKSSWSNSIFKFFKWNVRFIKYITTPTIFKIFL